MSSAITTNRAQRAESTMRWLFGIYFMAVGIVHFVVPDGLPVFMAWMYELSDPLHAIAGTAEILGGLGLILPPRIGVAPRLTIAAASGLSLVMFGAAAWHVSRGEWVQIVGNLVVAGVMAYVAVKERQRQVGSPSLIPTRSRPPRRAIELDSNGGCEIVWEDVALQSPPIRSKRS